MMRKVLEILVAGVPNGRVGIPEGVGELGLAGIKLIDERASSLGARGMLPLEPVREYLHLRMELFQPPTPLGCSCSCRDAPLSGERGDAVRHPSRLGNRHV